jgi:hypothetical protein
MENGKWKIGWWGLVMAMLFLSGELFGQRDTVPHIVTGRFDWAQFKKEMQAPAFQQNDLAIYILRKDSLGDLISQEENGNWIQDFHFVDVNRDRYLDAFYSGATKAKGGFYTYFMRAAADLTYPIKLQASGYVHLLKPDSAGVEFILRDDAHGKGYLHTITEYYYHFRKDSLDTGWQLQMVSTTEVPALAQPQAFVLKYPIQLRTSPRLLNEPPMDYNQDGKNETTGNVVANLEPGLRGFRFAEKEANGQKWSFVVLFDTPKGTHVFKPLKIVQMAYAGWIIEQ